MWLKTLGTGEDERTLPSPAEYAIALLEDLPGPAWSRIVALTAANLSGRLSYEGWRAACLALLESQARAAKCIP